MSDQLQTTERRIRIGANALALSLLAYSLISVVILPRA